MPDHLGTAARVAAKGNVRVALGRTLLANTRELGRQAATRLLLAQVLVAAVAWVANLLAARALGPAGRGSLALVLQLTYLGGQILLLGSERSFVAIYFGSSPPVATRAYGRLLLLPSIAVLMV